MNIHLMTMTEAKEVANWKYPEEYSFYDLEESPETIQELLDGSYYAVRDKDSQLVGFFCFGLNAQVPEGRKQKLYHGDGVLDIGLGMKPDLTGKGNGFLFVKAGIDFAKQQFNPNHLRLSVAALNGRAINVYKKMGFNERASFVSNGTVFIVMTTAE
ncbi:GNAT family N-acetyltransferase [Brevibacillus borstelensis]|uniref:GNAT family N-acetyltransferase n=1 Tax=Brevibacillus borstelensis TaxID=45462 RepID=UPI0030BDA9C4